MSSIFRLPDEVVLSFDEDSVAHSVSEAHTNGLQAQWQRSFQFIEGGASDLLYILFGEHVKGQLVATDLMLSADYAHSNAIAGFDGLWTPELLTPVTGSSLDTTSIGVFFDPAGATGTPCISFDTVPRPEKISPQQLQEGLVAAVVAYRWEIFEISVADIGTAT